MIFAIILVLITAGCKLSVLRVTGPSTALPGQIITIYVKGTSVSVTDDGVTLYGLILQLPDNWEVISARATIAGNYDLIERTEYEALYTPEPGQKIWVGTATESDQFIGNGTATVLISVGSTTGQYRIKAAVGSYRNDAWTTDDPAGKFVFSDITEGKYLDTIIVSTTASAGRWEEQKSIPQVESINGIWGTSATNIFTVGFDGTILHYDGTSWSSMTSVTTAHLYSIWGSSANDIFAVGDGGTVLHYDGTSWKSMPSGTTSQLQSIWGSSANDVFAVGGTFFGEIVHYDGTSWSPMSSGTDKELSGVWGTSANNVFAVRWDGSILHYNGVSWSEMSSGTSSWLEHIWGTSTNDIFAVGHDGTILHYDGTSWSSMTSCTFNILKSIWGTSANDVFAVGYTGTIVHYDGTFWRPMTSNTFNSLYGIWGSGTNVSAVGSSGTVLNYVPAIYVSSDGDCGGRTPCYSSIQNAINFAATGSVILVKQGNYPESLSLGSAKTLIVKGGYNATYDQQTGNTTFIQGLGQTTIQTTSGTLKFQELTIKKP